MTSKLVKKNVSQELIRAGQIYSVETSVGNQNSELNVSLFWEQPPRVDLSGIKLSESSSLDRIDPLPTTLLTQSHHSYKCCAW